MNMDISRPDLKKRKRTHQRLIVIGAAVGIIVAIAIASLFLGSSLPRVQRTDLQIDTVKRGTFVRSVRGPGKLVPSQMRWVVARTDASVDRLVVRPGAEVRADTVIIELSNPEVEDRLSAAKMAYGAAAGDHDALRAKLSSESLTAQSELASLKGEAEVAKVDEEANRYARDRGAIPEIQYKKATIVLRQFQDRVLIAEQRVEQLRFNVQSQLKASQERLEQLAHTRDLRQAEADSLHLRAGIDGVVQQIQVEEGQRVTAGVNLARVARQGGLIAELRIPEGQAGDVVAGQVATIEIGEARFAGKVRRVDPAVEKGAVLVDVDIADPLPSGARVGQSLAGVVVSDQIPNALFVGRPINVSSQSTSSVFKLTRSDKAHRTSVKFGKDSVNQIQLLEGLKEGDQVILSDMDQFETSADVAIQ